LRRDIVHFFQSKYPTLEDEYKEVITAESIYDVPQGKVLECLAAGIRQFLLPSQQALPATDSRAIIVLKHAHAHGKISSRELSSGMLSTIDECLKSNVGPFFFSGF